MNCMNAPSGARPCGHAPILRKEMRGASLVEVLVAVLLLSVGLLAMVGIQASALRYTKTSQFRTTASNIAAAYGEQIRANVAGALTGAYAWGNPGAAIAAPPACTGPYAPGAGCTPAQIALQDLFQVRTAAANSLPNGDILAVFNPANAQAPSMVLWVIWAGPENTAPNAAAADVAAWAQTEENCPAQVQGLQPRRQCMSFVVPL